MIRHGNRIFTRGFRTAAQPRFFVKQRAAQCISMNPSYARTLTVSPTQLPLTPSVLLQSSPLSFIETLEGSLSSSSSSSSLAVQADEEEDGEEGMVFTLTLDKAEP